VAIHPIDDTIAAIATPPGTGGIGIIRISGPDAEAVFRRIFRPHRPHEIYQSHMLYYGSVVDCEGRVLDEVLGVFMKAPKTYTREDVVELHSHGNYLVLQSILREIFACGVRSAEPGEFTKRAFLAGRIDLTGAEGVIELLKAQTAGAAEMAVEQLQGRLYEMIETVRNALAEILAVIEVAIDFPDEDVEIIDRELLLLQLKERVEVPLRELIKSAEHGKIIREGIKAVIVGCPNVGKSSLLNGLLREDRALVTAIPGTTRDTIEEIVSIHSLPVRIVDTAGIREHADPVEELGIDRTRKKLAEADLVLFMVDGSTLPGKDDLALYRSMNPANCLVVINKIDKADPGILEQVGAFFSEADQVEISAKQLVGIDRLRDMLYEKVTGSSAIKEYNSCAPNTRHRVALEKALAASLRLKDILLNGLPADLAAVEVQCGLGELGDIVGLTTPDDILDKIFSEFCIGK